MPIMDRDYIIGMDDYRKYQEYQRSRNYRNILPATAEPPTYRKVKTQIKKVIKEVNKKFIYTPDRYGDDWRLPQVSPDGWLYGDCDGYAAYIKEQIIKLGIVHEAYLRLMSCRVAPNIQYLDHMVLILVCKDADYVIDNRDQGFTYDWRGYPYHWGYRENGSGGFELIQDDED
jgi:predicted transglutaminase-like cysteine proteinase